MAEGWRCSCGRRNPPTAGYCGGCFRGRPAEYVPPDLDTEGTQAGGPPPLLPRGTGSSLRPVLIVVVVAAVALVAAIALTSGGDDGGNDVASDASVRGATTMPLLGLDDAVSEMSGYVARARGLQFKTPVKATLLGDAAFEKRLRDGDPVDETRIEGQIATLRALKLLPPDFDIDKEKQSDLSGVLGFYDPKAKELFVRGRSDSPYVRFVLVHELTHALDDQYYDLGAMLAAPGDVGLAQRTLIEGDAEDIARDYISTLSPFEQDLIAREAKVRGDDLYGGGSFYLSYSNFPYVAGKQFVRLLAGDKGPARLDAAFANPPRSSEQIIDINRYLNGDAPRSVARPAADGAVVDEGDLGQFELAFVLLQALPVESAIRAVEGWGGSRYVTWQSGARACTRVRLVMDSASDEAELASALRVWATSHGGATASGGSITACA
jgi:hypothetical protein